MLFNERAEIILQQVQLQSTVRVQELSELLQVSQDTVRRDLRAMEKRGLLKCVRGGACLPESLSAFSNFKGREIIHSDLKRAASRKAIGYIREGDIVALNSGTTNTILAQEIAQRVTGKVQPGSIVLFHNAAKHTPEALPSILTALIQEGYTFVPISQIILDGEYTIDHTGRQCPA